MDKASFLVEEFIAFWSSFPYDHLYFKSQMENRGRGGKDKKIAMEHRIILGNKFFKIRNKHIILKIIYICHILEVSNSSSKVCPFIF